VRPCSVVVLHVLGQYLAQMALADDQQPVEGFSPQGAYGPFAESADRAPSLDEQADRRAY